jgi:hypothetical protein
MSDAPNVRPTRHGDRWITNEQRKRADRANKAETNYQGVEIPKKNVIKLHETFIDGKLPSSEWIKEGILEFHRIHGRAPTELTLIARSITTSVSFYCPEITPPGAWSMVCLRIVQGDQVEIR